MPKLTATDHDARFVRYYEAESVNEATLQRFVGIRDRVMKLRSSRDRPITELKVLDIGCGAGTQCRIWARGGDAVTGIDISSALIDVGRSRAASERLDIDFHVGSAAALPFGSNYFDICLMPELLEHVEDWESCVNEALRVLKPGGVLFLSTTNWLCPKQQEYSLPLYSWYPARLKRRCEVLAVTTKPQWVNFAKYPAVHWFSYYQLSRFLALRCAFAYDRFHVMDEGTFSKRKGAIIRLIKRSRIVRFLAHVATPSTIVFAVKC